MTPSRICVALMIAAAAVVHAGQSSTQRPLVFRSNAELVEVDVVVLDRNGQRVYGLTRDDFIVRDRKQVQAVESFDEVRRDVTRTTMTPRPPVQARVDVSSNTAGDAGRLVVLVLDDQHVWQGRTETVKTIARQLVADLNPGSAMALLQTGGEHSVEVTTDRSRLLAAIDRFQGRRPVRRPLEACNLAPIKRNLDQPEVFDPGCDIQDAYTNLNVADTLAQAARLFGGPDRRRKAFILISESSAGDLTGIFDSIAGAPQDMPDSAGYIAGGVGVTGAGPAVDRRGAGLVDMLAAMRRSNVATYTIDPRGLVTPQEMLAECVPGKFGRMVGEMGIGPDPCEGASSGPRPQAWTSWVRQAQSGLSLMAEATGGFGVVNTDDFSGGISRILEDIDSYYLLGFYATDLTTRGFRPIDVSVRNRPDLTLRYRRGYQIDRTSTTDTDAPTDPLAALVTGAVPVSGVPLRMTAVPLPGSGSRARVAMALEVTLPRAALVAENTDRLLDDIRYGIYVVDPKGARVREHIGAGARIALRPRADAPAPPDHVTYQIALDMELPPGQYQLRGAAHSARLGTGGSVFLPVEIPDFSTAPLALTDLVVGYADGARVPVARDRRTMPVPVVPDRASVATTAITSPGARPQPPPAQPFPTQVTVPPLLPFEPTLDRAFTRTDTLRVFTRIVGRNRAAVQATITIINAEGINAARYTQAMGKADSLDARLPLAQLAPGGYTLEIEISEGTVTAKKSLGMTVK